MAAVRFRPLAGSERVVGLPDGFDRTVDACRREARAEVFRAPPFLEEEILVRFESRLAAFAISPSGVSGALQKFPAGMLVDSSSCRLVRAFPEEDQTRVGAEPGGPQHAARSDAEGVRVSSPKQVAAPPRAIAGKCVRMRGRLTCR